MSIMHDALFLLILEDSPMKILAQLRIQASLAVCVLFVCLFSLPSFAQEPSLNRYRSDAPDSLAAAAPAALVKTVTADPERKLPDLVAYLAKGSDDPFLTVKRIHDWIALNIAYDTSVPYGGKPPRQHWASVLAERKGVCSGYAELFKKMAELAGINAICRRYSAGARPRHLTEAQAVAVNHAWNGIAIGEKTVFRRLDVGRRFGGTVGICAALFHGVSVHRAG